MEEDWQRDLEHWLDLSVIVEGRHSGAGFRLECAFAAPLPQGQYVATIFITCTPCQFEHGAIKGGAIVVGQFNEAGFLDEAAQLYEMASACPALHDPSPRIGAALHGVDTAHSMIVSIHRLGGRDHISR